MIQGMSGKGLRLQAAALALAGFIMVSALVWNAEVFDTMSDPKFDLLVSQSILENGTITLNKYVYDINLKHHALRHIKYSLFNLYPLGSSVFSLPFVAALKMAGYEMYIEDDASLAQKLISSVLNPSVFVLIFVIGLHYTTPIKSFIITCVTFLGSPMTSSMGTALWSHNFGALFCSLSLLILARHSLGLSGPRPYLLGTLLFLTYFCRPPFSLFMVAALLYVLIKDRLFFRKTLVTVAFYTVLFVTFSLYVYGAWLPLYYMAEPFVYGGVSLKAVYGILLSPSRGLLVFSPFLVAVFAAALAYRKRLSGESLLLVPLVWFCLHMIGFSLEKGWWGGFNFGPRRFADLFPVFALATFIVASRLPSAQLTRAERIQRASVIVPYLALGVFAIWIHARQGLYNNWTQAWNWSPQVSEKEVFDWKYPQFLMTPQKTVKRLEEFLGPNKAYYNVRYDPVADNVFVEPTISKKEMEEKGISFHGPR